MKNPMEGWLGVVIVLIVVVVGTVLGSYAYTALTTKKTTTPST
jgi:hypothetical protein